MSEKEIRMMEEKDKLGIDEEKYFMWTCVLENSIREMSPRRIHISESEWDSSKWDSEDSDYDDYAEHRERMIEKYFDLQEVDFYNKIKKRLIEEIEKTYKIFKNTKDEMEVDMSRNILKNIDWYKKIMWEKYDKIKYIEFYAKEERDFDIKEILDQTAIEKIEEIKSYYKQSKMKRAQ